MLAAVLLIVGCLQEQINTIFNIGLAFLWGMVVIEKQAINVTIPANSPQEAKQKLIKFARQKVQVTVIDVKQSS